MNHLNTLAALITAEGIWDGNLGPSLVGAAAGAIVALVIWQWKKNKQGKDDSGK